MSNNDSTPSTDDESTRDSFTEQYEQRVTASRRAGNIHLDTLPCDVESLRGKAIRYVHNLRVHGIIRTVDMYGNVYVHWSDTYSARHELAAEFYEQGAIVYRSVLSPSDLKDYILNG